MGSMRASSFPASAVAAWWIIAGITSVATVGPVAAGEGSSRELTVSNRYALPLVELSGLALAPAPQNKAPANGNTSISLYGVGDATHEVVSFFIDGSSRAVVIGVRDINPVPGKSAVKPSQWEAVASDGLDTVCMLSETDSKVSCFDHRFEENKATIVLDTSPLKELNRLWQNRPNSRGEGMLLMKNGHLLILKEKKPSLLVEFGPEGDAPLGYGPDLFLKPGEAFALASTNESHRQNPALVALKVWEFSDRLRKLASDVSEIALGPDGHVYLLSQESKVLIRLEKVLKPDEDKINVNEDAWWTLPKGIGKAEGLAIDGEMRPWVGVDSKQKGEPNLFRLSPLQP